MLHPLKNKKGFTLIEILLVVFLIGLLATIAISSYTNSTENFTFVSAHQDVMSTLRNARSYAMTNKEGAAGVGVPDRYGVCVSNNSIVLFEDTGKTSFKYDPAPGKDFGACKSPNTGEAQPGVKYDEVVKSYVYTKYQILAWDKASNKTVTDILPLNIYYDRGSGNVTVLKKDKSPVDINDKYLALVFDYPEKKLQKYIVLFLVSGLAEEYADIKQL